MSLVEFTLRPATLSPATATHVIGIVVCDQFPLLEAARVVDVFNKANRLLDGNAGTPRYETVFVSAHGEQVFSSSHLAVLTQEPAEPGAFRALFVAGSLQTPQAAHDVDDGYFAAWLRDAATQVGTVCPIGDGAVQLHAAQLRPTGTAPRAAAPDAVAAALDIVRADFGADLARGVAVQVWWSGPQTPDAIALDEHQPIAEKIRDSARWIARHCDKRISITTAAQTAGMSERSYLRHFRAEMGVKPSEYLRRVRVDLASTLLADSDLPVDKIARRCGLTSGECLARLFRQLVQISPTEYRSRVQRHSA